MAPNVYSKIVVNGIEPYIPIHNEPSMYVIPISTLIVAHKLLVLSTPIIIKLMIPYMKIVPTQPYPNSYIMNICIYYIHMLPI